MKMSTLRPWSPPLYWILLLGIFLRFAVSLFSPAAPVSDEQQYLAIANEIRQNHDFALQGHLTAHRPPFYPFFLAICGAFSESLLLFRSVQSLIDAGTLLLIALLAGKATVDPRVLLGAVFLGAISPSWIHSSSKILSETVFLFLLYAGIVQLLIALKVEPAQRTWKLTTAGILLGLATLTRSVVLLLPFAWLGIALLVPRLRNRAPKLLIFMLAWVLTILPWTLRNAYYFHAFVPVNTMAGIVLYQGLYPDARGYGFVPWEEIDRVTDTHDEVERSRRLVRKVIETYWKDPTRVAGITVKKFLWLWNPFDGDSYRLGSALNPHTTLVYLLLMYWIVGKYQDLRRGRQDPRAFLKESSPENDTDPNIRWILLSTLVYFVGMALLFYGSPRFRMPIEPILWIGAGFGIARIGRLRRDRREPILVIGIGAILFLYLLGDQIKEWLRNWILL